jgi:RNA polymerase II C-terminal domain phosphatase-like 3/4
MRGQCKEANQDAFVACSIAHPDGSSPAMLIGIFDGHGSGGEAASQTAAGGLAGAVPAARAQLKAHACTSSGSSNSSSSSSPPPPPRQALVTAFQAVAASMAHDSDFIGCGAAGVACLVEEDRCVSGWLRGGAGQPAILPA